MLSSKGEADELLRVAQREHAELRDLREKVEAHQADLLKMRQATDKKAELISKGKKVIWATSLPKLLRSFSKLTRNSRSRRKS